VIVLSLVLVIAAAVLLVLGVFQDGLLLIYLSIFACLLAMGLLGIGVLLRRREVSPAGGGSGGGATAVATTARPAAGAVRGRSVPRPGGSTDLREDGGEDPEDRGQDHEGRGRDHEFGGRDQPEPAGRAAEPVSPGPSASPDPTASAPPRVAKRAVVRKAVVRGSAPTTPTGSSPLEPATSADPASETTTAGPASSADADRLAEVKGLGPAKKQALLDRFGDEQGVREATIDELTEIRGIGPRLARAIKDGLG
jgi:DNA uptake protein ComE-like DNA-binding protein